MIDIYKTAKSNTQKAPAAAAAAAGKKLGDKREKVGGTVLVCANTVYVFPHFFFFGNVVNQMI